jgi:hypothetical protein
MAILGGVPNRAAEMLARFIEPCLTFTRRMPAARPRKIWERLS